MRFNLFLLALIAQWFLAQSTFAQGLVGYTFVKESKQTPFQLALYPFSTDGCTRYYDGPSEDNTKWQHCCIDHDLTYWLGGTEAERKQADIELRECVKATGHPTKARLMYAGTRAGGGPLRQTTYRWGFGWNRVRDYHPLTSQEKEMAYAMYGENLIQLKKDIKEQKIPIVIPESYEYVSPFPYTFCEEQIINHLNPLLARAATVTKFRDFEIGSSYIISIGLDICQKNIEYQFTPNTTPHSCKKDYADSALFNKIVNVNISNECLKRIKQR